MNIKKHIPNTITCGNLFCGCLAIVQAFNGNLVWAAYLVIIAAILDFFDGFAARILNVSSAIGKDLDSLADMVTFGVVPGVIIYQLLIITESFSRQYVFLSTHNWINYSAFILTVFSCIRLAKFNNDTRQTNSFIGVPTPAIALFWCSLVLIPNSLTSTIITPYSVFIAIVICSFLLISEIPLFALKFKHFKFAGNQIRFVFLATSVLLLMILQFSAIPIIIVLYVLVSIAHNLLTKN